MTAIIYKSGFFECLNGRDLYKRYYVAKLLPAELKAIKKRLDEVDEKYDFIHADYIWELKRADKEWEYTFGTKLNPLDKEDLMEIKKGERLWLYYLESLIVRAINSDPSATKNSKVWDYPEFVPTEKSPTPLLELIDIYRDINLKLMEIENWLTEQGWIKRHDIKSGR